jgi:hypothetical protein
LSADVLSVAAKVWLRPKRSVSQGKPDGRRVQELRGFTLAEAPWPTASPVDAGLADAAETGPSVTIAPRARASTKAVVAVASRPILGPPKTSRRVLT